MKSRKRTELILERKQVLVIRGLRRVAPAWCERCREQVQMITAEEAACLTGVSRRTIYRWVENETLHFDEMPEGELLVCVNSLPDQISRRSNEP